ncbi:MAG: hypothetical protein DMG06_27065 [Acidobacteria bacterium]|nr:MAG: hypothetical protein DMG06_27065 [Acidobacteriota bacterium]
MKIIPPSKGVPYSASDYSTIDHETGATGHGGDGRADKIDRFIYRSFLFICYKCFVTLHRNHGPSELR